MGQDADNLGGQELSTEQDPVEKLLQIYYNLSRVGEYPMGEPVDIEEYKALIKQLQSEHQFFVNCTKKYPNLANYTISLLKNQRTDQDKLNEQIVEFLKKLLEHWKEHDLDETEYLKCRKCKIVHLLNFEMPQELRLSVYSPFSETKS